MNNVSIDGFGYCFESLKEYFSSEYGKGNYHALSLFRRLYAKRDARVSANKEYLESRGVAEIVERNFRVNLPNIKEMEDNDGTLKFSLRLGDGALIESVLIPMSERDTLCLSSQVGCDRDVFSVRLAQWG